MFFKRLWKWLVGRVWKGLDVSPGCIELEKLRLFCRGDTGQSSRDQKADRKPHGKDQAWEVSARKKDCIGCWTPHDVCYGLAESLSAFCSSPETLPETETKGNGLINLEKEIKKQSNIKAVAWLMLGAFSKLYVSNQEHRAQQDNVQCCEFGPKENSRKAVDCKDRVEILIPEEKQRNKKDGPGASQEVGPYPVQPHSKDEKICSEGKAAERYVPEWRQQPCEVPEWRQHREAFSHNQVNRALRSRQLTPTAKREKSLATAPASSKPWWHPQGADFRCKENAQILRVRGLPPRLQRAWLAKQCAPERAICEDVNMKPKVQWRPQKFGKARNVDDPREAAKSEQRRFKRKAVGVEITGSALGVESPKAFGAYNQIASDAQLGTLGLNVRPAGCLTYFVSNALYSPFCNFWNGNVYLVPLHYSNV
ncbi:uncharacterized protein LOC106028966 [Cavia porcellus]|uniref:uncharacterized protein LOC106028966 n=1 Tax=Cavia porcellus TaxID=10141 RepID=UPI002FDF9C17